METEICSTSHTIKAKMLTANQILEQLMDPIQKEMDMEPIFGYDMNLDSDLDLDPITSQVNIYLGL